MKRQLVDLSRKEVLIVDDAPDNLRVLTSLLADRGFYVQKDLNGAVALQACKKQLPDLILLDITFERQPRLSGKRCWYGY